MADERVVGGHRRIRPFNPKDTYPEQSLANDLAQAVVANDTVYLRGQVAQDLETRENVGVGDPAILFDLVFFLLVVLLSWMRAPPSYVVF